MSTPQNQSPIQDTKNMNTSKKNWPERPLLDFTHCISQQDKPIVIKVGIEPNNAEFRISKLRLDYYSPYFRVSLVSKMKESLSRVVELQDVSPKIFRHIAQYMNAQSILIPGPPQPSDLQAPDKKHIPVFNTLLDMPHWHGIASTTICPDESLDLGTLARIWFLADYLIIPHVQNIAINLMYRRLLPQGSPLCYFGELADAAGVALGIDGTLVKENNEVQKLLESYLAYCSGFDEWTPEQRAMIPRAIMDGAMVCLRKCARAKEWCESTHMRNIMEGRMERVGYFFVEDELDGGKADSGLDPEFHYLRVLEW